MKKQTNYVRGVAIERKLKKLLESHGWLVFRSAGSHGAFDLIAQRADGIRNIQCKRVKHKTEMEPLLRELRLAAKGLPLPRNASYELWAWVDRKGWYVYLLRGRKPYDRFRARDAE